MPRVGRRWEVGAMAKILDTRTDPDELGDLVDPWDEWLTDQIEYEDLPDDLKAKAREGLKPVGKSVFFVFEPGLLPVLKHPGHGDQKVHGRRGGGSDASIESRINAAQDSGDPMGLGLPCSKEVEGTYKAFNTGDAAADDLIEAASEDAYAKGLTGDSDFDYSDSKIYGQAVYYRALCENDQEDSWQNADPGTRDSTSSMIDSVRREGTVCIAVDPDSAVDILESGRVMSQFETGTSSGVLDGTVRARAETALFDVHPSVDDSKRTIYGYVAGGSDLITSSGVNGYGQVRLVLNDSVKSRTTMTAGDSLNTYCTPVPMTGRVTEREAWGAVSRHWGSPADDAHKNPVDFQRRGYFEAQIHGGNVRVSDITEIRIKSGNSASYAKVVRAAEAAGVRVVFEKPSFRLIDDGSD